MNPILSSKQMFLIKRLNSRIKKITAMMHQEGMASKDIHLFFAINIFQIQPILLSIPKKLSKEFSSETQEQTNSQNSEPLVENFQTSLERVILERHNQGLSIKKILLQFIEKSYVQQEKLKNYLAEENVQQTNKTQKYSFDKIKLRMQQKKYLKNSYRSIQDFMIPNYEPSLERLTSIKDRVERSFEQQKRDIQQSQNQLDYIRSFEKSLSQSIKKTKMLRSLLEERLANGFSPAPQDKDFEQQQIY